MSQKIDGFRLLLKKHKGTPGQPEILLSKAFWGFTDEDPNAIYFGFSGFQKVDIKDLKAIKKICESNQSAILHSKNSTQFIRKLCGYKLKCGENIELYPEYEARMFNEFIETEIDDE